MHISNSPRIANLKTSEKNAIESLGQKIGIPNLLHIFERGITQGQESVLLDFAPADHDGTSEKLYLEPNLYEHIEAGFFVRTLRPIFTVKFFGNDGKLETQSLRVQFVPACIGILSENDLSSELFPISSPENEVLDQIEKRSLMPVSRNLVNLMRLNREM